MIILVCCELKEVKLMKEKNKGRHNCHVYEIERINNFKEMIDRSSNKYGDHIAYKFKINLGKPDQEIIEKSYSDIKKKYMD